MIEETKIRRRFDRPRRAGWRAIIRWFRASRKGAASTEYAFILAFIALIGAVGFVTLGDGLRAYFDGVSRTVETAKTDMPSPLGGGSGSGASSGGPSTGGPSTGGPSTGGTSTGGPSTGGSNGNGTGGSNGNANGKKK